MTDIPSQKWRGLANKAGKWTIAAAKEVTERGTEAAKAADKMVREEIQRQKELQEARLEAKKREAERIDFEKQELERKQAAAAVEQLRRKRIEAQIREPLIREWFANKMNNVTWKTGEVWYGKSTNQSRPPKTTYDCFMGSIQLARSLSSMTNGEVEILKYLDILISYEILDQASFNTIKLAIIYNEGHCEKRIENYVISGPFATQNGIKSEADAIHMQMSKWGSASKQSGIALFLSRFSVIERDNPQFPIVSEIKSRLIGGSNWLQDSEYPNENFSYQDQPDALLIGESISGQRLYYVGEGSLVSIAPPGSGKTQCNVFPNLLSYKGPAIVLDVKGECFEKTGLWRKANVGPIFRFSPLDVETSG